MVFFQFIWLAVPVLWALLLFSYFTRKEYRQNRSMIFEAAISLLSTFLLFFTWWLMLPILVLFPLVSTSLSVVIKKPLSILKTSPYLRAFSA